MKTTTIYEQFEDELLTQGYSPETVRGYVTRLSKVVWHFQKLPDQISELELRGYLMHLVFEQQSSYTNLRSTIASIRAFFRLVLRYPEKRILELVPALNTPRICPDVYTPEEIGRILSAKRLRIRHRTMLMTLYAAGLRPEEVCGLKVSDIESSRMQIHVAEHENHKEHYAPLSRELLQMLRSYWRIYRPPLWLFATSEQPERRLHHRGVTRTLRRAIRIARIPDKGGAAVIRHSFAVHSLELGVDLATLQRFLGHQWIVSTATYVHVMRTGLSGIKNPLNLLQTGANLEESEVAL